MTETMNTALETVSRTFHEGQKLQTDNFNRLLNAVWVADAAVHRGIRDVQTALSTDWPTVGPQPLDQVLDEFESPLLPVPDAPEPDPETAERIARIAASFDDAMGRNR